MLTKGRHDAATAIVVFPTAKWLGPLRWWLPWKLQAAIAGIGRLTGVRGVQKEYTTDEDWEAYLHAKRS